MIQRIHLWLLSLLVTCTVCDEFRIAWLAPTDPADESQASTSVAGLSLALDRIDQQGLLSGDNFTVKFQNTTCDPKNGISAIYKVLVMDKFNPDIIIGPPCTNAMKHVGELAGYKNLPIFTWLAESSDFGDKGTYNSLVRAYGPVNEIAESLIKFLNYMTWTTVELISTTSHESIGQGVYDAIISSTITLARWVEDAVETADSINGYYATLKREARIVILAVPFSSLRTWMLAAYDNDMVNGEFVFIYLYNQVPTVTFKTSVLTSQFYLAGDGRDVDAMKAFENILVLTQNVAFVDNFPTFSTEAGSVTSLSSLAVLGIQSLTIGESDPSSVFLHDAVLLWAHLVNESKALGLSKNDINGSHLLSLARNRSFSGNYWATGPVYIDDRGDREPDYWLLDMGAGGIFSVVMETQHTLSTSGVLTSSYVIINDIIWGDGTIGYANRPTTVPVCGYENEKCTDLVPYIVPPVVIFVLLVVAVIVGIFIRKYQFEQSLKNMMWKIDKDELKIKTDNTYFGSTFIRTSRASSFQHSQSSRLLKDQHSQHTGQASSADGYSQQDNKQVFIQVASYKKSTVALKVINKPKLKLDRDLLIEMRQMSDAKHANLARFIGATTETPELHEVWEYCPKGSLYDVIFNDSVHLDNMFKFSIASDIFKGLKYLHKSALKYHGNLKSSNCIIDSRWVCKLTDFGLVNFHANQTAPQDISEYRQFYRLLWTSPEALRSMPDMMITTQPPASQHSDIYAGAVILKEIFARNTPYSEYEDDFSPKEIVDKVKEKTLVNSTKPFRPDLKEAKSLKTSPRLIDLMREGWNEEPEDRPSAGQMVSKIQRINPNKSSNVMDNMIKMLESYSNNLEGLVQERLKQVEEEKKKSETLLYRMLPQSVAEDLKKGLHVAPEAYDAVSIYFSDIVSFTKLAAQSTPMQVVYMLNLLYTQFDAITQNHDVYKVETIGDAYMYVSGLPKKNDDRHAVEVSSCAMDLLGCVMNFTVPHLEDYELKIRIGIHTGPVVAGVVGVTMPRYCLFGDSVTVASLMESGGQPMRIHFSEKTFLYLSRFSGFHVAERGLMDVKGKKMKTYFLVSKEGYQKTFPDFDELAKGDNPPCKKLPVTKGKVLRVGPIRPSTESGFYGSEQEDNSSTAVADDKHLITTSDNVGDDPSTKEDITTSPNNIHVQENSSTLKGFNDSKGGKDNNSNKAETQKQGKVAWQNGLDDSKDGDSLTKNKKVSPIQREGTALNVDDLE